MKRSAYIQRTDAQRFFAAIDASIDHGQPVNTLITVNLEQIGIEPEQCSSAHRRAMSKLKRSLTQLNNLWAYVWVLENIPPVGVHAHILIHRATAYEGENYRPFTKALHRAYGFKRERPPARAIRMTSFWRWRADYEVNLGNLERYCLKGIRPECAEEFGIAPKPQGMIMGKRIGWYRYPK